MMRGTLLVEKAYEVGIGFVLAFAFARQRFSSRNPALNAIKGAEKGAGIEQSLSARHQ
jgi:hypothetical protein